MPDFDESRYDFACEALNSGGTLTVSPLIPVRLAALIRMMLLKAPADRPAMKLVFEELKAIANGKPSVFTPRRPGPAVSPPGEKTAEPPRPESGPIHHTVSGSGARVTFNFGPAPASGPVKKPETTDKPAPGTSGGLWDIPTDF